MRRCGVLMHITSLPGPYGVGTLGAQAYRFVDFLKSAGQSVWQVLPLNPTGYGNSPYQSYSGFAGNHYLIDLEQLVQEGLLYYQELKTLDTQTHVDFGALYNTRLAVLRLAFSRFCQNEALDAFCEENKSWLGEYALYMALKEKNGGKAWYRWKKTLKFRNPDAIDQARQDLQAQIRFYSFVQYLFFKQWTQLKAYANRNGISIIGDLPIYVPLDSVEVWCQPHLFDLDDALLPVTVAGCPPDAFSDDGQLWGNPLYRCDVMAQDNYRWWQNRLAAAYARYDMVRLDHFRGFESYWAVPYGEKTARNGCWKQGPGMALFDALKNVVAPEKLIAEDLGLLTPQVTALLEKTNFPGMKVLQFAFDSYDSMYLPHNCTENSVCYPGTHDNMTTAQWLQTMPAKTAAYASEYMHLTQQEGAVWGVIRTAMSTVCKLCIVQMQDYLALGGQARMNCPGTQSPENWSWRAESDSFTSDLARKMLNLAVCYARDSKQVELSGNGE